MTQDKRTAQRLILASSQKPTRTVILLDTRPVNTGDHLTIDGHRYTVSTVEDVEIVTEFSIGGAPE